ncbi:uncharacterized protein LOC121875272 [Homarus americanus]|uniref:Uncharacterized protein n=1 Tax=Homarus americanus TaxID=6706 RepID=A0A8J5JMY7_HOMAM|nr:uncharacterized protein LOC121875272 [Homarus americanus]KAG7161232.1 hypothetical protein Hamer_G016286 [Homarus americanus]
MSSRPTKQRRVVKWDSRRTTKKVVGRDSMEDGGEHLPRPSQTLPLTFDLPVKAGRIGRGKALQMSTCSPIDHQSAKPINPGAYYTPVGITDCGLNVRPAVPGDCYVRKSWKNLSNAPVAYQVQQMLYEDQFTDDEPSNSSSFQKNSNHINGKNKFDWISDEYNFGEYQNPNVGNGLPLH